MISLVSRTAFDLLAGSQNLERLAARFGMRRPDSFARRFIAGETIEEAIAAARAVESRGLTHTLDYLSERITTTTEADQSTRAYLALMDRARTAAIDRHITVRLTQLGVTVDRATSVDNIRRILDAAGSSGFFVQLETERSPSPQVTLDIFETMWTQGYRHVGIAIHSHLRRSAADVASLNQRGARVRLVKGGFAESKAVAYRTKSEVDASFLDLMRTLLTDGTLPAIATHDPAMIAATREFASSRHVPPDQYEFQIPYGVRRDVQVSLAQNGLKVRVVIPFGRAWYQYVMRRLGERPANVGVALRSLLRDG
jgi:proline dehydrogenase